MSFIGDIERSLAQLWPLRVPITPVAAAGPEATVLLAGEFVGADDFGEGRAELIGTASDQRTLSLHDFSVLNEPDRFVYLSQDLDTLTEDASVIVWRRAFSVLFAAATLEPPSA